MQHEFHDLQYNHLALMNAGIDEIQYSCWHERVAVFLYNVQILCTANNGMYTCLVIIQCKL